MVNRITNVTHASQTCNLFLDPYAVVSFCNNTHQTEKQMETLCPIWDQTLVFDEVPLTGRVDDTASQVPNVVVEIFDWNEQVRTYDRRFGYP